jgi:ankyrin repeat protein
MPVRIQEGKSSWRNAIALAAANGNTELIRLLLDKGVDPNTIDPNQEPVTWAAIRSGNVEAVRLFLDRGATVDFKDSVKQSSLMLAVREDEPDIVRLLISRGAEVNAVTRVGATTRLCSGRIPCPVLAMASALFEVAYPIAARVI